MIKKYIRGNNERSSDVIKELEKLGGVNRGLLGNGITNIFCIDMFNFIDVWAESSDRGKIMLKEWEEIILPEPFKSEMFSFKTMPEINRCEGCVFNTKERKLGDCRILDGVIINCNENKIIFVKA